MSFKIQPYNRLTTNFSSAVDKLTGRHRADTIDKLPEPRRSQTLFLTTMIEQLNKTEMKEEQKSQVLSAAMIVVRQEIKDEYWMLSPEQSLFFQCLTETLGIKEGNALEAEDRRHLISEMMSFMESVIYIEDRSEYGLIPENPFLSILGDRLSALWERSATMIRDATVAIMERNLKNLAEEKALSSEGDKEAKAEDHRAPQRVSIVAAAAAAASCGAASSESAAKPHTDDGAPVAAAASGKQGVFGGIFAGRAAKAASASNPKTEAGAKAPSP